MARRKNLFLTEPKWPAARILRFAVWSAVLVVIAAAGWMAWFALTPADVPEKSRQFNVEQGRSLRAVAAQLARNDVIAERWSFVLLARALGVAEEIKAGSYETGASITPYRLLDKLVRGEFTRADIRFTEGWNFRQIRAALDQHPSIRHDTAGLSESEILERIGASEKSIEGWIFPDTYSFAAGTSDLVLLRQAHQKTVAVLQAEWEKRAANLPLKTPYDALTLASIVEKETGRSDERELVSAVFVNRIRRGMRLQTDPTVIYGLGPTFDGNLRRRDLLADGPYNTYMRIGLPPTPIAMPGEAAIRAALNPAQSKALYFVSRGDGSHQFSATLVEHNVAVNRYQKSRNR